MGGKERDKNIKMKTNRKFVIQVTGPAVKYRLDILAKVCPNAKDYLVCLTNRYSYELYKEYHNFFHFVIMDEYRKNEHISLKHEVFPNYNTEDEYYANINSYYGHNTGVYYSYDISRFVFPYMIEKEILNFCIIDSDFILNNDAELLDKFFLNIPVGTIYAPWQDEDIYSVEIKKNFWKFDIQPSYQNIELSAPFVRNTDGFTRGFHFKSIEDMKLLYSIWNTSIDVLLDNERYRKTIVGNNGKIFHLEWVISQIMQFFEYQKNYKFIDSHSFFTIEGVTVGKHCTRPEDTFILGPRWVDTENFDYSNTKNIASFIQNNKKQLASYYSKHFKEFEITDTHVYTKTL